jgi:ABC-type transporter Mla maintaining outer membrane lipid asymmetry permease subunit MlaE
VSGVIKGLLMAFAVTTCSYLFGVASMDSAQSVGTAVTKSVVIGSISVVAVDVLVSSIVFAR